MLSINNQSCIISYPNHQEIFKSPHFRIVFGAYLIGSTGLNFALNRIIFHHGCKRKHFIFSHIITLKDFLPLPPPPTPPPPRPFSKVRVPGFKSRSIYRKSTTHASISKSGMKNSRGGKRFVLGAELASRRQLSSFRRVPRSGPPRTRRGGTGTLRSAARAQRGAVPPGKIAAPQPQAGRCPSVPPLNSPRARLRKPPTTYPAGSGAPGTQARQLGRAASAAMTATQEAPRAPRPRGRAAARETAPSAHLSVRSPGE